MNEYEKQANDFLAKTNTILEVEFKDYAKYFDDDKEKRFIWNVLLKRGNRSASFTFGGSIKDVEHFVKRNKALIMRNGDSYQFNIPAKNNWDKQRIEIGLERVARIIKVRATIEKPSAYTILACIEKSDPETFEDFCSNYGYDTDSRKAEKTYKAVKDQYKDIAMLYSDDELQELQEIN